jgi:hyaluronan synthase
MDIIKEIKDPWITQKFLGQKCTYGDDRRLSNEVLMAGKKIVYTPRAVGWSDSPTKIMRYVVQQTRWSKSFCREIWWTLGCAWRHNVWLAFECMYQITYFFLIIYLFSRVMIEADPRAQTATVVVSTAVALVKCAYFAIRSKDIRAFFFVLYTYVYFFVMIPARITAILTMYDISWGTRGGGEKSSVVSRMWLWIKQYMVMFLWWALVLAGGAYSVYDNWYFQWDSLAYRFALMGIASYLGFIAIMLLAYGIGRVTKWNYTKLQKILIEDKNTPAAAV